MKLSYTILITVGGLLFSALSLWAEKWVQLTDRDGRSVEARLADLSGDELTLYLRSGDRFKISLVTLSEESKAMVRSWHEAHYEDFIKQLNAAFGRNFFSGESLWEKDVHSAAQEFTWRPESRTSREVTFRNYPMGRERILGEPVFSAVLAGFEGKIDGMSFVFLNRADAALSTGPALDRALSETAERIGSQLSGLMGEAVRQRIGTDRNVREWVQRWDWRGHAFLLSEQTGNYVSLRVLPVSRADNPTGERVRAAELRTVVLERISREANGDVLIRDIPMVDQGPKGFCVPATFERTLRYLGIPSDMYLFGVASMSSSGGTYLSDAIDGLRQYIRQNGRVLREFESDLRINTVSRFIDRGIPVMWLMSSSPAFNQRAGIYTEARRQGSADLDVLARGFARESLGGLFPHMCLIVGYNRERNEIAISDSWGPAAELRWVPLGLAQAAHMDGFLIVDI